MSHFYLGVGSGISVYEGDAMLPWLLRSRIFFPSAGSKYSPYLTIGGAYALLLGTTATGEAWIEAMPGVQIPTSRRMDVNVSLGYVCSFGDGYQNNAIALKVGIGLHPKTKDKRRQQ